MKRRNRIFAAGLVLAVSAGPVLAREVIVPIHWSNWSRDELSIARMRVALASKIHRVVCESYRNGHPPGVALRSGNTINLVFYGAGGNALTNFSCRRSDC